MSSHKRIVICEQTLLGALLGFAVAWLASATPSLIRLATPGLFALATWLLVTSIKPWLTRYFRGSATNSRTLIARICICMGSWIAIWFLLGECRNFVFANSFSEAIYMDQLSLSLFIALVVTAATVTLIGLIFPSIANMVHFSKNHDSSKYLNKKSN